jgi:hypothetical protein
MKLAVYVLKWIMWTIVISMSGVVLVTLIQFFGQSGDNAGCESETITKSKSPDGAWIAIVREDICSDGTFVTVVTDSVHLESHGVSQKRGGDVLTVDGGGDFKPKVHWLKPTLLQILIPNKSLIGLKKDKINGVKIRVKFNPNDPEERKRWLKEIERGPRT